MMIKKRISIALLFVSLLLLALLVGCSGNGSNMNSNTGNDGSVNPNAQSQQQASQSSLQEELVLVNDGTLTILLSPDYPPFESIENGELVGFDVDLGRAIAEKLGLEPEFVQMQFDNIIPTIKNGGTGDIGISGFSIGEERDDDIDFTNAYFTDSLGVAVRNDSAITFDNSKNELNGERMVIGVQTGTTGETFAQENFPNAIVQGYANSMDCFAALRDGSIGAVCTNLSIIDNLIDNGYGDVRVVLEVATAEQYACIVSNENIELTMRVNEVLAELMQSGEIQALMEKWM